MNSTPSPWGGGSPDRLVEHIHAARLLSVSVWVAADVPKIRDEMIDRLVKAIAEANELAKEAPNKPEKGGGGVAPKAHWYRLFGYLVQVLLRGERSRSRFFPERTTPYSKCEIARLSHSLFGFPRFTVCLFGVRCFLLRVKERRGGAQ